MVAKNEIKYVYKKNLCKGHRNSSLLLQGIEALEGYIDPSTGGAVDDKESKAASDSARVAGETTI